ncbi:MAG: AI-2E family transporter [Oscillospiraceae bacterium]|nr:AI-2E family transporter [Oscillospiraceae bacterium]
MRYKFRWDKKYLYWGITVFCVGGLLGLLTLLITRFPDISGAVSKLTKVLSPFIWGLVIAYLLTPLKNWMERALFLPLGRKLFKKTKKKGAGFARFLSVFISLLLFLLILAAMVYLIPVQLVDAIESISAASVDWINALTNWAEQLLADNPEVEAYVTGLLGNANKEITDWLTKSVAPQLLDITKVVTNFAGSVLVAVYNLVVGIVVSLYILANLEKVKAGCKRLLYSIFSLNAAEKIRDGIDFTHRTFMGFFSGKLLDSAIIGLICYVFCLIAGIPSAGLVSVLVGVTNIIPFFGPFIGAVPSALIILATSPVKCLIFIIFVIILQQVDGNIIGPKILGGTTGINGFWVMFSIIVGAGLFGFWGMLLGVPVFVVIYTFIDKLVKKRLERSDLPSEMEDYQTIDHIDAVTHEVIRKTPEDPSAAEPEKAESV